MKKVLLSELLIGLALTILVAFSYFRPGFLETIELKFYDLRSQARTPAQPAKEIALITIDDDSLAKLGRWPWPRTRIAELLNYLSKEEAKPKVIGLDIIFSEPEQGQGKEALSKIIDEFSGRLAAQEAQVLADRQQAAKTRAFSANQIVKIRTQHLEADQKFMDSLKAMLADSDQDSKLTAAIAQSQNIVLPIFFHLGAGLAGKPKELPEAILRSALSTFAEGQSLGIALQATEATIPLGPFAEAAVGIGHVNTNPDQDGVIRREPLAILYGEQSFPSFALEIVKRYLGVANEDVSVTIGKEISLSNAKVPLDEISAFALTYNGPEKSFPYYSFYDVIQGKVAPEAFKDKIVIVGPTAAGVGTAYTTPLTHNFPSVEVVANVVENLLHKRFLTRPSWAWIAEISSILILGLFVSLVLPKLKAMPGAIISMVMLAVLLGAGFYLFSAQNQWLKVSYPAVLLAAGYTLVISKRFLVTERGKELVEASAIETNKMLGLSFQGQGMLDLAFEKFRKCPVDEQIKELLYNLGLDFERKRQFNKAVAVYEHIFNKDKNYKDIPKKIELLKRASDGAVMGGQQLGGKSKDATVMVEGASVAATLGRYEIVRELGKGAMGIVYLGKDPKINRQVAVKTMRFEDDVDDATIKAVKERFFREAESAGNLSHPNIIKIYDAGDEHDVSYIAMELLEGHDLKKYITKETLLPVPKVLEYTAIVADALDYAHKQGVVHRDIKPANIMLLKDSTLRVTDFGIARIQASSKTATGTVLGTPSYMSPEQIAGKKVDGRSDLFSLGVMMFEMLTGEKPWKGGDSVGTLLFQIANDPYPDPLSIRKDLPKELVAIIDKALKKNPEERYANGAAFAADIRSFLQGEPLKSMTMPPKPAGTAPVPAPASVKPAEAPKPAPAAVTPAPAPALAVDKTVPSAAAPKPVTPPISLTADKTVPAAPAPVAPPAAPPATPPPAEKEPPKAENKKDETAPNQKILDIEKTLPIINPSE